MRTKVLNSKTLAKKSAGFADDMKAQEIVVLEMKGLVNFCDYFVIATGTSDRHVKAIAEGIAESLTDLGVNVHKARGLKGFGSLNSPESSEGAWILLDMGDVVAHIFEPQAREFYALEHLWQDAPKIKIK